MKNTSNNAYGDVKILTVRSDDRDGNARLQIEHSPGPADKRQGNTQTETAGVPTGAFAGALNDPLTPAVTNSSH